MSTVADPQAYIPIAAQAVIAGDAARFTDIVRAFDESVRRIVSRTVRDAHAVEDVVQETWVRVYRQIEALLAVRRADQWVGRIARNCALDWRRQRQRIERLLPPPAAVRTDTGSAPASDAGPDWVWDLVATLPDAQCQLLTWRYREAHSYREIASRLRVETSTVRGRLHEARNALRKRLERRSER